MDAASAARNDTSRQRAQFRYGFVFLLIVSMLVFVIVAPGGDGSRSVALALEWAALLVVVATSRERLAVRRARAGVLAIAALIVVVAVAAGALSPAAAFAISGVLALAILVALVRGLLRLVSREGVTVQVVAGALTIYVLAGMVFAWIVSFVARVDPSPFFAEGADRSAGDHVYYSFTVLTTTGFGDLTAATSAGRALAVVEMLMGQLYLVTVIGVVVGGLAGRARS